MQTSCALISKRIPRSFKQTLTDAEKDHWIIAMEEEFNSLNEMNTWTLVKLPNGRKPIRVKWVFDLKTDSAGSVERYRARLVAMGIFQQQGIDYFEVFAPVVKYSTVRLFFCVTTRKRWK